ARSNAYYGAWALNTDASELPLAASAARVAASDAYWFASKENIEAHGGMGFTWEVDCHLYYRRSRQLALVAGAPRVWKERLVRQLERRNAS
ncbi:MAG: acyl-CoA dehydrogenase family protein, partial [Janthinobacterium lividum]